MMDLSQEAKDEIENQPIAGIEDISKHEYFMKEALQMVFIHF
jgi:hypothetical protein